VFPPYPSCPCGVRRSFCVNLVYFGWALLMLLPLYFMRSTPLATSLAGRPLLIEIFFLLSPSYFFTSLTACLVLVCPLDVSRLWRIMRPYRNIISCDPIQVISVFFGCRSLHGVLPSCVNGWRALFLIYFLPPVPPFYTILWNVADIANCLRPH